MKLLSILLLCQAAWATTFMQQPFPDAVNDAPIVARGKIGSSTSDWGSLADGQRRIYTFYDFALSEVLKGPVASTSGHSITIREMGGSKNGVGMEVAGTARFDTGEDVVVFLNPRNADGSYDVRGMMMGKLDVKQDENGNDYLVGPALIEKQGNGIVQDDTLHINQGARAWTLDRLRRLIDDQKSGNAHAENSQKPRTSPSATPVASPRQAISAAPAEPAPGLQPGDSEETGAGSGLWSRFGIPFTLVALCIGAAAFLLRRRK